MRRFVKSGRKKLYNIDTWYFGGSGRLFDVNGVVVVVVVVVEPRHEGVVERVADRLEGKVER